MWKEHQEMFLEHTRWLLKEKLYDTGIVMRNIEDFDQILLAIGEKYHEYCMNEEL